MIITTRNTNTIMWSAYQYLIDNGIKSDSRNGPVISVPHPVTICYTHPWEQVNFCPVRDANPFFHFIEKLWFLEAKGDVEFICRYLPSMSDYSDDGVTFRNQYGKNIRSHFGFDQLKRAASILADDPTTRRVVVQIWKPEDLGADSKDLACNQQLLFRVVDGALNMTVTNRSNDALFGGVSGANITNLFVFQEYVSAYSGIPVGKQYIISNDLHLYTEHPKVAPVLAKYTDKSIEYVKNELACEPYTVGSVSSTPIITNTDHFDQDLQVFMDEIRDVDIPIITDYHNDWFIHTATPVLTAFWLHKTKNKADAIKWASMISSTDWRKSCMEWLERRL